MKKFLLLLLLLAAHFAWAEEAKEDWQNTTISDDTIKKIQQAQFVYKKCVVDAMQAPEFKQMDSRNATDVIIRKCEPTLAEMRKVYIDAEVPGQIADRHLKKLRIEITRKVLQELMFIQASRQSGQP